MPASLDMQKVTADVCAEMFGIVAELANVTDWSVDDEGMNYLVHATLVHRARDLNAKLTAVLA